MILYLNQNEVNQYLKKIKEAKAKVTPQRVEILNIFLDNKSEHFTADDILKFLDNSNTGQATVYRTLELFSQIGILKKVNFKNEDVIRYDLVNLERKHFHHHFICDECGKVIEINEDLLETIEGKVQKQYNFVIKNHELILRGICHECQKKGDNNDR